MRKLLALIISIALMMSLPVTASAASLTDPGDAQGDVTASYVAGTTGAETVFSVDIAWNNLNFTYNGASAPTWDPDSYTYAGETREEGWAASNASVTVTNHSNVFLKTQFGYTRESTYSDAKMVFSCMDSTSVYVGSADNGQGTDGAGAAQSTTIEVVPTGSIPEGTAGQKIGTINVNIQSYTGDVSSLLYSLEEIVAAANTQHLADQNKGVTHSYGDTYIVGDNLTPASNAVAAAKSSTESGAALNHLVNGAINAVNALRKIKQYN